MMKQRMSLSKRNEVPLIVSICIHICHILGLLTDFSFPGDRGDSDSNRMATLYPQLKGFINYLFLIGYEKAMIYGETGKALDFLESGLVKPSLVFRAGM